MFTVIVLKQSILHILCFTSKHTAICNIVVYPSYSEFYHQTKSKSILHIRYIYHQIKPQSILLILCFITIQSPSFSFIFCVLFQTMSWSILHILFFILKHCPRLSFKCILCFITRQSPSYPSYSSCDLPLEKSQSQSILHILCFIKRQSPSLSFIFCVL